MFRIGPYSVEGSFVLAPMAGVSDRPFRDVCRRFGAAYTIAEMSAGRPDLLESKKTQQRLPGRDEPSPRTVQIVGNQPEVMAEAARQNVALGAQIIDINFGCPAKKVCRKAAGSALLAEPDRVEAIIDAIATAVDVPVTIKMRTGPEPSWRNGVDIAVRAVRAGAQLISVHGRTRACAFKGAVEYDTIAAIKDAVSVPVIANGDIHNFETAQRVFALTGADALMIGRGAYGRPWIFAELNAAAAGRYWHASPQVKAEAILDHIHALHNYYGDHQGVRIARKHINWYLADDRAWRKTLNAIDDAAEQRQRLAQALNLGLLAA
ncbi:tRNA dihydrouridine synthase DusB [Gammaproteobacteria bacterium]|nr:tRNA dihydrouridine synthase DusB [Gammaproteobacteria bacterium]